MTKTFFKIRQSKIALKQALTLKLGVTLVVTVTQVYVFVNLCRVTPDINKGGLRVEEHGTSIVSSDSRDELDIDDSGITLL